MAERQVELQLFRLFHNEKAQQRKRHSTPTRRRRKRRSIRSCRTTWPSVRWSCSSSDFSTTRRHSRGRDTAHLPGEEGSGEVSEAAGRHGRASGGVAALQTFPQREG